jgi:hypothetical protein
MFLGHTSTQCFKEGMSLAERKLCCEVSSSKNDVLSYCRNRGRVNENIMHGFEHCNQSMIDRLIVPAMIQGGDWNVKGRDQCQ